MKSILIAALVLASSLAIAQESAPPLEATTSASAGQLFDASIAAIGKLRWTVRDQDAKLGIIHFESRKGFKDYWPIIGSIAIAANADGSHIELASRYKGKGPRLEYAFAARDPDSTARAKLARKLMAAINEQLKAPAHLVHAASPAPEMGNDLEIDAPIERVKAFLMDDLTTAGFGMTAETEHQVTFVQDRVVQRDAFSYLLFGENLPAGQRVGLTFTLIPQGSSVKVRAQGAVFAWNGYGYGVAANALADPRSRAEISRYLQRVKLSVESPRH